jgi:hypothetical protein
MTKDELKKDIYYELRDRFKHTTDPYRDIATFALNEFFADYVANKLSIHDVSNRREQLIAFADAINVCDGDKSKIEGLVDLYLKSN